MSKILDTKEITKPLYAYPLICIMYTSMVIGLISLAGRLSFVIFPVAGRIYIGVDFFLVPLLFFFQNVVTEVYGYERCRQLNQMSIVGLLIFFGYSYFSTLLPIPKNISNQDAFNIVISTYTRHFVAFLFALYFGAMVNQYLISKLKIAWEGKWLWLRSIASTFLGDFTYQLIGSLISRYGVLHMPDIISYDLLSYVYKLAFEIMSIPFVYIASDYLKNLEEIDIYDKNADYNPFKFSLRK
jgi:uncharacterized integral membrane protein (TIGR00697 family)